MDIVIANTQLQRNTWDAFVMSNARGNHLALSTWLESYKSYGFDYELCLCKENDTIIGGYAAVIAKVLFFKFYIIPHGPIFIEGKEAKLNSLLAYLLQRAKTLKCCYTQISLPISSNAHIEKHVYTPQQLTLDKTPFKAGKLFSYLYCSYGMNWVNFKDYATPDDFLKSLTPKVRRNIRMGYNKGVVSHQAVTMETIRQGYQVIEETAQHNNYQVRSFDDFGPYIHALVKNDKAVYFNLEHQDTIKATVFAIKSDALLCYRP